MNGNDMTSARLKSLAYGMLGSVDDAEEIVQEARLRLHVADPKPDSEEAFLYRVVSNLCVDRLRRARTERKHYFGPWLPEPVAGDHADQLELARELTMGFMVLMETLSPAERIVYVLREAFDFSFDEVADVLGVSPANARQRAHRARKRLQGVEPPRQAPRDAERTLLESMVERVTAGDARGLVELMSEDVVVLSDGGGVVSAAIRPVYGAERIAQVVMHLAGKVAAAGPVQFSLERINGNWSLVLRQHGQVHSCHFVEVKDGCLHRLYVVRNPHKLKRIAAQAIERDTLRG